MTGPVEFQTTMGRGLALLWILILTGGSSAWSQSTWRRAYGGFGTDEAFRIIEVSEGGYLVLGTTGSFGAGASDIYALRIDVLGEVIWSKTYGGPGVDQGAGVVEVNDGFLLAGTTSTGDHGGYDMVLIKIDLLGELVWERSYGTFDWDLCHSLVAQPNGGAVLCGVSYGEESPLGSGVAYAVDDTGEPTWQYIHDPMVTSAFRALRSTPEGDVVLVGWEASEGADRNGLICKLNEVGEELWVVPVGGDEDDEFNGVAISGTGNVVACGSTRSGADVQRILIVSYGTDGAFLWEQFIGNTADAGGREISRIQGGGYVLTGYNTLNFGTSDMILTVIDEGGWFQFGNNFGNGQPADGYSILSTLDGGFVVSGWCENYGPGPRAVYVVKTDQDGQTSSLDVEEFLDPLPVPEQLIGGYSTCHPNPINAGQTLHLPRGCDRGEWALWSATGRKVGSGSIGSGQIVVPDISPGLYFVHCFRDGRAMYAESIVVLGD